MKFDAYCTTLPISPEKVLSEVFENLPYSGLEVVREKGKNNYEHADLIKDGIGKIVCSILHGGNGGKPHLRAQGPYSPDIATIVRGVWPEHPVTRADVAIDFDGSGAFSKLLKLCKRKGTEKRLKMQMVEDPRPEGEKDPLAGSTLYLGSRSSTAYLRLYEKGKQQITDAAATGQSISLDWTRLEIEVKPQHREMRYKAAFLKPEEFWGVTTWSRDILMEAYGLDVERVNMNMKMISDERRAFYHMSIQYRSTWEAMIRELGSMEAACAEMQRIWATAEEERHSRVTHPSQPITH